MEKETFTPLQLEGGIDWEQRRYEIAKELLPLPGCPHIIQVPVFAGRPNESSQAPVKSKVGIFIFCISTGL